MLSIMVGMEQKDNSVCDVDVTLSKRRVLMLKHLTEYAFVTDWKEALQFP